jgi:hypothetical protein
MKLNDSSTTVQPICKYCRKVILIDILHELHWLLLSQCGFEETVKFCLNRHVTHSSAFPNATCALSKFVFNAIGLASVYCNFASLLGREEGEGRCLRSAGIKADLEWESNPRSQRLRNIRDVISLGLT